MPKGMNLKAPTRSIAVFGSSGRIGKPLARYVRDNSSDTLLRLIIRSEKHREGLQAEFPQAEIVTADYYDLPSLEQALKGMNGVFVVTPNFIDEERAMTNLIYAVRRNSIHINHIVRLLGDPPGMTLDRVPRSVKAFAGGTAIQHMKAKAILEKSELPITYMNIAAYFFQNFTGTLFNPGLRKYRTLACPHDRRMAFLDCDDMGYCGAAILLSDNHRHIGATYHLDNGNDVMWFSDVAKLMSDVWQEEIRFDDSPETYVHLRHTGNLKNDSLPMPVKDDYFVNFSLFELENETIWRKSDIVEYLTGSKAKKLSDWLVENQQAILG